MHSSKIKMNILFDLIPAWLGGYKKSIFKHASNASPARHNKVLGELQLSAADFENSIHTHNHEWVTECVLSDDDADCERKGCCCAGEFNFQFWQQV